MEENDDYSWIDLDMKINKFNITPQAWSLLEYNDYILADQIVYNKYMFNNPKWYLVQHEVSYIKAREYINKFKNE